MAYGTVQKVLTCDSLSAGSCVNPNLVETYLVLPAQETFVEAFFGSGGLDLSLIGVAFGGMLVLWVIGLGLGSILAQIRKTSHF